MRTGLAPSIFAAVLLLGDAPLAPPACAQAASAASAVETADQAILANPKVIKTLEDIKADDDTALAEQKRITEIPAPPYKEHVRAEYYLKRFQELALKDAFIDTEGNVIGLRKGSGGGRPKLVVSAHLDTVFPEGTDVSVKEKDGVILAPGIGDDSRGLAALLSLIKSINANGIATVGDVMFVGTGEEELGNLRGVKALFRDHADIDGFISIDGLGITRVVNQATGSHRYEMIFRGGGTSVNAIAGEARMAVDMRSNSTEELLKLEARLLDLVKEAVVEENARWNSDKITVEIKLIGDRPAGIVAMDSPIVQATQRAVTVITRGPRVTFAGSSTDSNLAMSLGIPAVTIIGLFAPIGVVKWLLRTEPEDAGILTLFFFPVWCLVFALGLLIGRRLGLLVTGGKRALQR